MSTTEKEKIYTYESLIEIMEREITIMREMLSNLHEEHRCLLENDIDRLQYIMSTRETLNEMTNDLRTKRTEIMHSLPDPSSIALSSDEDIDSLFTLDSLSKIEDGRLFSLKETMIALITKIQEFSKRNGMLLESRISLTKRCISNLHNSRTNTIYGLYGTCAKKRIDTVTILNREV